ncbi:MAG TPA: hypothetical protein DIS79_07540 [Bacteroidetes bacterium]|nr:hypothetical protein [Bacteroidota bacterium]HRK03962.1 hypothetical protein [Chlorobiota bacterium]
MRVRSILGVSLFLSVVSVYAQQQPPQPQVPAQPNQPIELPEFIVTGKERVDIPGGAKQAPVRPPLLSASALDSLNPTLKQPLPPLPPRQLPLPERSLLFRPGYVEASFGNYVTPNVLAGYSFEAGGYRIDAAGAFEASQGWIENADYSKFDIRLLSSYVAPEKFIFFGGSTTEVDLSLGNRSYRLFGAPGNENRSVLAALAGVNVDGKYGDLNYQAGATWSHLGMSTEGRSDIAGSTMSGYAVFEQRWNGVDAGGKIDLRFASLDNTSYPFLEGSVFARFVTDVVRLRAGAGFQSFESTTDIGRGGLLISASADVMALPELTIRADLRSGLTPFSWQDLVRENPYIATNVVLDAAYDILDLSGTVLFHPSSRITASAGVRLLRRDREAVWIGDTVGTFLPAYVTVTRIDVPVDIRWILSARDVVTADMRLTMSDVVDAKSQPYLPSLRASVQHDRVWSPDVRSLIGLIYVGERWADLQNTVSLSGYIDVRARVDVRIHNDFTVFASTDNLLGSSVVLWRGYTERAMFVRAGITWNMP